MLRRCFAIAVMVLASLSTASTWAHPGGVDDRGGHTNRKTGEYHCHRQGCDAPAQVERATREAERERRAFVERYDRKLYKHWSDVDGDCMNTRHEMLQAASRIPAKLSPNGCYVSKGEWFDPFSGQTFTRASDLDVDHVIPLAWAHAHGAYAWTAAQREQFANDPENLLVVDDGLNQAKGKKGPSEWLPPRQAHRCEYLGLWQKMLNKYSLTMAPKEKRIFTKQLAACQ